MSLNHDLSELFRRFAAIMEIKGESVFKAIAFSKVSRSLGDMTVDIHKYHENGKLGELEGIGSSSQKIIREYIETGHSSDFDEVSATVPAGLIDMLGIPSLGPKTIGLLWKERNITSIDELITAIGAGKLEGLKGIGEKKIEAIKQGIELRSKAGERMGIAEALPIARQLVEQLRAVRGVRQAEIAGSLRRRRETIGDVDLICATTDDAKGAQISEAFAKFDQVARVLGQGPTKASIVTHGGLQVDLRIVPQDNFGAALMYFTGSKDHNVRIRGMAQDKGMTLNEWGLYKLSDYEKAEKKTGEAPQLKALAGRTEAEVYKKLGMDYVEPEMREDRGEVDLALKGKLPTLITIEDYRGDLHCHTTASDGTASIEQMAEAASARGYKYLGITDHSKSSVIANGLTVARLMAHVRQIRKVSDRLKTIKLLAGCEVDILADGHLDFEDAVLSELDFVVASPHVALKQDTAKSTDRLLRAIENRYVSIIGHPTGRLINARAGLPLDFERIFNAAAANGTALEINAGWPRLDLNDLHAHAAIAAGVIVSIDTDAHSIDQLDQLDLGIAVARRAWATKRQVINCMEFPELMKWIARKREGT